MLDYKNLSGMSNVCKYEVGDDCITVVFGDGRHYLYTYKSAGAESVEQMKRLALSGKGLGSMLATKPYHKHEKKWR